MTRARGQSGPTISLFPFLAVLLCTMGSLLVVLVIFSRSAKQAGQAAAEEARTRAVRAQEAERGELELAREELGWRVQQLREVRDRTADALAKARMQLAGTEDDARKLADELDALGHAAEALEKGSGDEAAQEAILDLERRLADAKKALDEAKDGLAAKPPAYAVVPYEGKNATHRRPLYIECCIDGVFLQPEGIRLGPADFEGPPGPGNPLASALRAAREHIARSPGESGDPRVQPYPLLLVRPSGVMAYYAARESIQSWGSEFGYQFIDEEWTLSYPPRDPVMADAETRAIEEARRRLEWLAQVRPVKQSKPATQYRAATTRGGVVSNSGPSVLGDQSRFDWTEERAGGGGAGSPGRGFNASGTGSANGDGVGGDAILGNRGTGQQRGQATGAVGGGAGGGSPAAGEYAAVGSRYAGPSKFYSGSGSDGAGVADGTAAGAGTGAGAGAGDGAGTGDGAGAAAAGSSTEGGPGKSGGQGDGGQGQGSQSEAGSAGGATGATAASGGAGSAGGGSGPAMPGLHQPGGAASAGGMSGASAGASLAGKRGSNWASLATQDNPVPLTRPIRLECAGSEFRILGEGGRVESRIPIGTNTVDSIDPLVREVHAAVGRWGLAGERMYWKPELVLVATPDGVGRRDDLERLLADSGIDTRRSEAREKVRYLPPVQRTGGVFPRR
ncbi:MAG: hypothetical protein WD060_11350 [Pirellulales bacterium]